MSKLVFIDIETTGLDPMRHQAYEVCWWREESPSPSVLRLPHDLDYADDKALEVGQYHQRGFTPYRADGTTVSAILGLLTTSLRDATLVGSNPGFDAAFLARILDGPVWHHRLIDVAQAAQWIFGWDRGRGLAGVVEECQKRGYEIPTPDHTAEGDVRATRAVYEALRAEQVRLGLRDEDRA